MLAPQFRMRFRSRTEVESELIRLKLEVRGLRKLPKSESRSKLAHEKHAEMQRLLSELAAADARAEQSEEEDDANDVEAPLLREVLTHDAMMNARRTPERGARERRCCACNVRRVALGLTLGVFVVVHFLNGAIVGVFGPSTTYFKRRAKMDDASLGAAVGVRGAFKVIFALLCTVVIARMLRFANLVRQRADAGKPLSRSLRQAAYCFHPHIPLGIIALVAAAGCLLCVVTSTTGGVIAGMAAAGAHFGFSDTATDMLALQILPLNSPRSRFVIALFNFVFSIGAFLAPLAVAGLWHDAATMSKIRLVGGPGAVLLFISMSIAAVGITALLLPRVPLRASTVAAASPNRNDDDDDRSAGGEIASDAAGVKRNVQREQGPRRRRERRGDRREREGGALLRLLRACGSRVTATQLRLHVLFAVVCFVATGTEHAVGV